MKKILALILVCLTLSACTGNGDEILEKSFKIKEAYSADVSGEMAVKFISVYKMALLFDSSGYLNELEATDDEQVISDQILETVLPLKGSTDVERDMISIMYDYLGVSVDSGVYKAGHVVAKLNEKVGVQENKEYLNIDEQMEDLKVFSKETLDKFLIYIE